MRSSALALLTLLGSAGLIEAQEEQAEVGIAEAVVAISIDAEQRLPVGADSTFNADVGQLWFFTRITGATEDITVEHVWYHGDEERARVPIAVRGSNWRTWSSKNIVPEWTGAWRVEVVGPDGSVLTTVRFTVQ